MILVLIEAKSKPKKKIKFLIFKATISGFSMKDSERSQESD